MERFSRSSQSSLPRTTTLITRLHHNVIKTVVKTISLAYSKITFADIRRKLKLDSPEDAEFIVIMIWYGILSDSFL